VKDMQPADVAGPGEEYRLNYYDGSARRVIVTDRETAFPIGELIVSQTDREGVITMCTEAFVRMSGFAEQELLGEPHSILRHPAMPGAAFADLWDTVGRGERWTGYVKNLRKDGGFYWVYATVIPKKRGGEIVGYTSVRRQPSRKRVEAAEALYRSMMAAPSTSGEAT
jgi:PAS domain S-box-containing protein